MKNKKMIIGIVVTLIGLGLFVRQAAQQEDWGAIGRAFLQARYWLLIPSLIVLFSSLLFRAYRWRVFLHGHGEYGVGELFAFTSIGFMGNSIFPARAGEIMRCILLAEKKKVSFMTLLATVVVERLFDLVVVIGFFAVTLLLIPLHEGVTAETSKLIRLSGQVAITGFLVILVVLLAMTFKPQLVKTILSKTIGGILPAPLMGKILSLMDSLVEGLSCLRSVRQIFWSLFWSVLVWLAIGFSEYLIFIAFTDLLGLKESFFVMALIAFAVAAPSTPGYLGVYDVVCQSILIGMFLVDVATATSSTLILHASQLFPIILLGFVCLWWQGLSFRQLRDTEKRAELKQAD
ncbi:MAG TPA: lysylphosphatidylglycerol synthase transmembrane domain-containing protein [bacterium]|nr:lysylphosphatidylglycerol synthase transmembrane domain-containing protein [bacterium]